MAFTAMLLLLSVVGNIVLLKETKSFYTRIQAVRLDPLGKSARNIYRFDEDNTQRRLLIVGDSRAAEWQIPNEFLNYEIVNGGIGSQTTAQVFGRIHEDLDHTQPDIVLIQAGINDLKTLALFPERREEIITNCKSNLENIVAHSAEGDRTVILSTIFPVGRPSMARRIVWSSDVATGVDEVNKHLNSLSAKNVIILDSFSILYGVDGLIMREYSKDTLHLNDAGYTILNKELMNILEEIDGRRGTPQPSLTTTGGGGDQLH
ncbi:MAG: hypothetical protein JJU29_20960, partial [Verrucomicrobia bacterium]|nr:hypothetical protein [Verrucomicrobiota bacterium]